MQTTGERSNGTATPPTTISVALAGRLLNLCEDSVYKAVAAGQLPGERVGRRWLIPTAKLREFLGCTAAELAHQIAVLQGEST